jgi:hypothetical protein
MAKSQASQLRDESGSPGYDGGKRFTMTFDELLEQIVVLLQRDGRVTYRALKRRFDLDDDYLTDLCGEIIKAKRLAVDENGEVLVWAGKGDEAKQEPANRRIGEKERCLF